MELETHHKHLLRQRIQDNRKIIWKWTYNHMLALEVMKKIKEKFKNSAILDNILIRIQAKQNEASELNKNKESNNTLEMDVNVFVYDRSWGKY